MYIAPRLNRKIIQVAFVVNDLELAAHKYIQTMGVGPFYIVDRPSIIDETYRGKSANVEFSTAITQAGDVQIEFVQQHCDSDSSYRDIVKKGHSGFHHIAIFAENFDEEMKRYSDNGNEIASSGRMGSMRFGYVDTHNEIGAMTEVLEDVPFIRNYFSNLSRECSEWNGERPIRNSEELF